MPNGTGPSALSPSRLTVCELFHSIQGESSWAGTPCSFVRLAGCHLRCTWCDTPYAFTGGTPMEIDQVVAEIASADLPIVEITGGEPLLQPAVYPLMEILVDRNRPVLLETSGTLDIARVPEGVHRIMDLKPPGSGQEAHNRLDNLDLLDRRDEVKMVLTDRQDYLWARQMAARFHLVERVGCVIFSPVHQRLAPALLASWILEDRLHVRLGIQLHRVIWPDRDRGA
ncbi:MAG: radical SAM protein [Bradymonadales bacterium]|nr:radical SAM protein [Bradymonadales bacterium]